MDLKIRPANESDYDQIARIYALPTRASAGKFTGADQFKSVFNYKDGFTRKTLDEYLNADPDDGILVAEVDGQMVGILTYLNDAIVDEADGTSKPAMYIGQLSVKNEFRGMGIGKALMNDFYARMEERGYETTTLDVFRSNEGARALYLRQGYKDVNSAYDLILDDPRHPVALPSSGPGIKLHFATAADWDKIQQLEAARPAPPPGEKVIYDDLGRREMDRATFENALAAGEPVLIAEDEQGKAVGYAHMEIVTHTPDTHPNRLPKKLGEIFNVALDEKAGKGVFDALVRGAADYAEGHGLKAVRLYAAPDTPRENWIEQGYGVKPFRSFMARGL